MKIRNKQSPKNILHIAVLANQLQVLLLKAYFKKQSISKENLIAIPLRNLSLSNLYKEVYLTSQNIFSRYFWRSFSVSFSSIILRIRLFLMKRPFYLYLPWDNEYGEILSKNPLCIGVVYVEEGDLSYWTKETMYDPGLIQKDQIKERRLGPARKNLFSKFARKVICTTNECFPCFSDNKKEIIKKSDLINSGVESKLSPNSVIGVMPSASRIIEQDLTDVIEAYLEANSSITHLKLHPSFIFYPNLDNQLELTLKKMRLKHIEIIGDDVILEEEMLINKHCLIGLNSSLERYAKIFGSSYTIVEKMIHLQFER